MGLVNRIISVKIPDRLLWRVDAYASRRGMARSEVIREAILAFLASREALVLEDEGEPLGKIRSRALVRARLAGRLAG